MKIYLDPGHGEGVKGTPDPGAIGPTGLTENTVTFDLAKRLEHLLREKGYQVLGAALTAARDDENLNEAIAAANAQEADLFISLHCNAAASPKARGVEAWYGGSGTAQVVAEVILHRIGEQLAGGKGAWVQGRRYPLVNRGAKKGRFAVLTNARLMKSGDALNQVMRNCLVSLDDTTEVTLTQVLDLLAGDRLFLLVKLRQISLGDELTVSLACPRCRTTTLVPVNLEDLPVTPYPPEREYTTVLPGSGRTVRCVPLDGHMEKRLVAFPDSYQSQAMLMRIREIDGMPPTKKTLTEMVLRDYNALYAAMLAAEGGIDTAITAACDGCGALMRTRIEGEKDFLYPGLG